MRIAFGYKLSSGKDTAVNYLISKYGGTHMSFAAAIYDILRYAQQRCGFPIEKDRQFLQYVGTNWARSIHEDVWVKIVIDETPSSGNAFISDLRFPNEFAAMKENGWVCVKLVRNVQDDRVGSGSKLHISETALDNVPDEEWDYIIDNNGTLEDFYNKLDILVNIIK